MAQDKDQKTLNVPPLRFPGFTDEWRDSCLLSDCDINPKSSNLEDKFVYLDLESVEKGELRKYKIIERLDAPSRAQRVLSNNDVLFQCVRPYQQNNYLYRADNSRLQWVASTGYAQLRVKNSSPEFIYHLLSTQSFTKKVIVRCTGSNYPAINSEDLSTIHYQTCSLPEQKKIANFLTLLDERIATQNKIIDNLQSLIKGVREKFFKGRYPSYISLGEIAQLYQPKTIATSELEETGYLVYGANGIIGYYHSYNHEQPQICITCRGNTCGQVTITEPFSWITGNAMVVNIDTNEDIDQSYLFHFLSSYNFNPIISGSGQPQIVRNPLAKIKVPYLEIKEQKKISRVLDSVISKIDSEQNMLRQFQLQKNYLVNSVFI